jgi:hypothetical protein
MELITGFSGNSVLRLTRLRFWHQLSEQETAHALGNSVGT